MPVFEKRTRLNAPVEALFAFHESPGALERLTPPWERVTIVSRSHPTGIPVGLRVELLQHVGPLRQRLVAVHTRYEPPTLFVDEMVQGPFKTWRHEHRFERDGDGAWLVDRIEYALPLDFLGEAAAGWYVRRRLEKMFAFRHAATREAVEPRR